MPRDECTVRRDECTVRRLCSEEIEAAEKSSEGIYINKEDIKKDVFEYVWNVYTQNQRHQNLSIRQLRRQVVWRVGDWRIHYLVKDKPKEANMEAYALYHRKVENLKRVDTIRNIHRMRRRATQWDITWEEQTSDVSGVSYIESSISSYLLRYRSEERRRSMYQFREDHQDFLEIYLPCFFLTYLGTLEVDALLPESEKDENTKKMESFAEYARMICVSKPNKRRTIRKIAELFGFKEAAFKTQSSELDVRLDIFMSSCKSHCYSKAICACIVYWFTERKDSLKKDEKWDEGDRRRKKEFLNWRSDCHRSGRIVFGNKSAKELMIDDISEKVKEMVDNMEAFGESLNALCKMTAWKSIEVAEKVTKCCSNSCGSCRETDKCCEYCKEYGQKMEQEGSCLSYLRAGSRDLQTSGSEHIYEVASELADRFLKEKRR